MNYNYKKGYKILFIIEFFDMFHFLVHGVMGGQQQGVSTVDMERTLKSLNGYHEVEVCCHS